MKKFIIPFVFFVAFATGCSKKSDCVCLDRSKYPELSSAAVQTMAQHYMDLVAKHSDMIILQVSLEGPLLRDLLCNVENLKLIPIADSKDVVSMALEFDAGGKKTYNDVKLLFKKNRFARRRLRVCLILLRYQRQCSD